MKKKRKLRIPTSIKKAWNPKIWIQFNTFTLFFFFFTLLLPKRLILEQKYKLFLFCTIILAAKATINLNPNQNKTNIISTNDKSCIEIHFKQKKTQYFRYLSLQLLFFCLKFIMTHHHYFISILLFFWFKPITYSTIKNKQIMIPILLMIQNYFKMCI